MNSGLLKTGTGRRKRSVVVCTSCRDRKLKCDRKKPCSNCVKFKQEANCHFDPHYVVDKFLKKRLPRKLESLKKNIEDCHVGVFVGSPLKMESNSSVAAHYSKWNALQPKKHRKILNIKKRDGFRPCCVSESTSPSRPFQSSSFADTDKNSHRGNEVDRFLLGQNIYGNETDTINFYDSYSTVHFRGLFKRINFGPLAWTSLMRRDKGLDLIWKHSIQLAEFSGANLAFIYTPFKYPAPYTGFNSTNEDVNNDVDLELQFGKRALQLDGFEETLPLKRTPEPHPQFSGRALVNSESPNENPEGVLNIVEKIKAVLPQKRIVCTLVDRFFEVIYPHMPYLDEEYFEMEVTMIIGQRSYDNVPIEDVKIEKKLDLAVTGTLLVILRLAFLSLLGINNVPLDSSSASSTEKYISEQAVNIAELCLEHFQLLRGTNILVLQLALYIRLYHTFAPEDGDGADGGDMYNLKAILIQMAYSLGFNREPGEQFADLKTNNLIRKIWAYLVLADLYMSYSFGTPLAIDSNYSDTKMPFHVPGGENLIDKKRDEKILNLQYSNQHLLPILRLALNIVLNVKKKTRISIICEKLNNIELVLQNQRGSLNDCVRMTSMDDLAIFERNLKVKNYLACKAFLLTVYFHLFLTYETIDWSISLFYLRKCLLICLADLLPHLDQLLGTNQIFGSMIINPTLQALVHKVIIINAFILRFNFMIYHLKKDPQHNLLNKNSDSHVLKFTTTCNIASQLTKCAQFTIKAIANLGKRYYYAWRISKSQNYLLKVISKRWLYERNYRSSTQFCIPHASIDTLKQIERICVPLVHKLEEHKRSHPVIFEFENE